MAVNVNYAICSFRDQIQTGPNPAETASGNSSGWGFRSCRTEGGGTLARVVDPLDATRQCIRHALDLFQAQNRAQIGCWGDVGSSINNILTHPNGIRVAMRVLIPEIINPGQGAVFISLLDHHAVDAVGGNRWDTRPGWMLYRQGLDANNMKVWDAWHGEANADYDQNLSINPLPIGRWFWLEEEYKFDAVERPIPMWIDGLPFHSTMPRRTMNGTTHVRSEVYSKWYGGGPWAPMTPLRYTGEFLMGNQGQIVTDVPVVLPPPDTTAPLVPTGLIASAVTQSSLILSWSPAYDNVGVIGYRVYRDGTSIASPASTFVSIAGLAPSTTYSLAVSAVDAAGNASGQSAPVLVTTLPVPVTSGRRLSAQGDRRRPRNQWSPNG